MMSGKFYMRVGKIEDGRFQLKSLNYIPHVFDYFDGFEMSVENMGKDFYKIGSNMF